MTDNQEATQPEGKEYRAAPSPLISTIATVLLSILAFNWIAQETDSFTTSLFVLDGNNRGSRTGFVAGIIFAVFAGALATIRWIQFFQRRAERRQQ